MSMCGWEGGGRKEGKNGNGWTVGRGITRTGIKIGMSQTMTQALIA